jgi:hypothetical protein
MKAFDATGLRLTALDTKRDSTACWQLDIISGTGGLVLTVSAIDLSDILSDSGIEEAGDVATRTVRPSPWKAAKLLRKWTDGGLVDEMYVKDGRIDGPEALLDITSIADDERYLHWTVNLSGSMWLEICRLAVAAVGYPWFREVQENAGSLDVFNQPPSD